MAGQGQIEFDEIHGALMAVGWFGVTHVALWATVFKHYYWSLYIHIFLGLMITLIVGAGSMLILSHDNFDYQWYQRGYHNGLGAILFYITPVLVLSGTIAKVAKTEPIRPYLVTVAAYQHRIIGWIFILASRPPLYTGFHPTEGFPTLFFIIFDGISFVLFWIVKLRPSSVHKNLEIDTEDLREVSNEKNLEVYGLNYFIYGNHVYSIERLLTTHPGGFTVIDSVRGREVDRFIYGGQFLQGYDDTPYQHSTQSLYLPEDILARINIPSPFKGMYQLNKVSVHSIAQLQNSENVYLVNLISEESPFQYRGYSAIEQIGRFYSLTARNRKTRLYSPVNFARSSNVELMKKVLNEIKEFGTFQNRNGQGSTQMLTDRPVNSQNQQSRDIIPLLIKRYPKKCGWQSNRCVCSQCRCQGSGRFTSRYLSPNQRYQISHPLGFGLSLASFPPGKIVMISGGTGFYPFSDLIDLLYKSTLISEGSPHSRQIQVNDPILASNPFQPYNFEIYSALRNVCQLHPVSIAQMNKLAQKRRLKCVLRADINSYPNFRQTFPHIEFQRDHFDQIVNHYAQNPNHFSGILICGPGKMSHGLVNILKQHNVSPNKYRIV